MRLYDYYSLLSDGFLHKAEQNAPGFLNFPQKLRPSSNIPCGVVANRSWRALQEVTATWRLGLSRYYQSDAVMHLMRSGRLKPTVFTDVDFAILGRDAQGHVDQYVADRATLESLGFIATFYDELKDPNLHLSDILAMSRVETSYAIGQQLFKKALTELAERQASFVRKENTELFKSICEKPSYELNDDDYALALSIVDDAFYKLVVDPITEHINGSRQHEVSKEDVHHGIDRMNIVYTTQAAFSHSQIKDKNEMIRHRFFGDFDASTHLFDGVQEFFGEVRDSGVEVVAITRGNQFPYLEGSPSEMGEMFDRIHSTLLSAKRTSPDLDPIYPDKKIRSYSMLVDPLSTTDKVRIIFSETLQKFNSLGLRFNDEQQLLDAVGTYLDRCVFITDSDLEVWGTCPTIGVLALRTPTDRDINRVFSGFDEKPKPIAIINPQQVHGPLHGFSMSEVLPSFDPKAEAMQKLIFQLGRGMALSPKYVRSGSQPISRSLV